MRRSFGGPVRLRTGDCVVHLRGGLAARLSPRIKSLR
jgi:hypothetical protein